MIAPHPLLTLIGWLLGATAAAAPVQLFRQPGLESPVAAEPDDILLLAGLGFGDGDAVVYRVIDHDRKSLTAPTNVPTAATAERGVAPVVAKNPPYSVTVRLPRVMSSGQAYALWVHSSDGGWSRPVLINDARPRWVTPAFVYATQRVADLPREIKVVGRNLQGSRGHSTRIRLLGPERIERAAVADARSAGILEQYAVRLPLPAHITPGVYRIQLSRDGATWAELPGQTLLVRPDEPPLPEFSVSETRFGGCHPDDGLDDTPCVLRALAAAKLAGAGTVVFGPGVWDLIDGGHAGVLSREGIIVAAGINLRGAGSDLTTLQRHPEFSVQQPTAALTLTARSQVSGFTFHDTKIYGPLDHGMAFLQLGENIDVVGPNGQTSEHSADDLTVTGNTFDKTYVAIGANGRALYGLFLTSNTFGAYHSALELSGDRYHTSGKYQIEDSVIAFNLFDPGSKLDLAGPSGTIASELGAAHRVDFSSNTADGAAMDYLYSPQDAKGWRAAFFWNMDNNIEDLLVSQNTATCTGDKIGDGEAFAFDNNANTFAFERAAAVVAASNDTVTVAVPLMAKQNGRAIPLQSYYIDHWIQVVGGRGLGQSRKIVGYTADPTTGRTTFRVMPAWDVVPEFGTTRITVGREFWQLYVIDNTIDNRQPLCQKSNRSRQTAGAIALWAQSSDSVIAGNHQYDSDGIFVQQSYIVPEHPCADCSMQGFVHAFLEIRDNEIDGEYDWDSDCSRSGIGLGIAAAPWDPAPPTVGFGVSISHNHVRHADAQYGGGIAQLQTWTAGPEPHRWALSDGLLIQHNIIQDIEGAAAKPVCGSPQPRAGITFPAPAIAWHTVLYGNSCKHVGMPLGRGGIDVTAVCPAGVEAACECGTTIRTGAVTTPLQ